MIDIDNLIEKIESDMISMWFQTEAGDILNMIEDDPEYINTMMKAMFYERDHYESLGMVIGES
jgi:hypothetical protein|tara:strand:+ start:429 stop:617 length:189 start_codon:yes stop_codon:yes gene_type:complete